MSVTFFILSFNISFVLCFLISLFFIRKISPSQSPANRVHTMPFHTASYWGKAHQMLLQGWPGSSTAVYVVAVLLVFFLAILAECLAHVNLVKSSSNRVAGCLFTAGMRAVRAGIASMAILAVMSYNAGIFIATIVGHAVGYAFLKI